jgi:putative ABC transport system substrate-binding protein
MGKQRPNGLYMLGSPLTNTNRKRIADFALKSLPSIYSSREFVDAGGLMTYRPDEAERYRRVGGAAHEV